MSQSHSLLFSGTGKIGLLVAVLNPIRSMPIFRRRACQRWVSWSGGVAEQLASFESQKLLHIPVSAMMSTSNVLRK